MPLLQDGDGKCLIRKERLDDPKIQKIAVTAREKGVIVATASPLLVVCNGESVNKSAAENRERCSPGTVYR